MKEKFKIGDRVRIRKTYNKDSRNMSYQVGDTGTIKGVMMTNEPGALRDFIISIDGDPNEPLYYVEFDRLKRQDVLLSAYWARQDFLQLEAPLMKFE